MNDRWERRSSLAGIAAVALWIAGLVLLEGVAGPPDHATDRQLLANVRAHETVVILGAWLFMLGCVAFVWFGGTLRARLARAEQGVGTFSAVAFAGVVATAVFGMGIHAGRLAAAIDDDSISASTAGALRVSGDLFFVAAELSAIVLLAGAAVVAFRTRALPRWWAVVSAVIAIVLVIGPIGWAALIFAFPAWTLVTSVLLARAPRERAPAASSAQPSHA